MPNNHAILSASSSHRWLECPPSAKLCSEQPDIASEYAQEGTDAHTLCEHKLKSALGMETVDPTENLTYYDEEMERCANEYALYVSEKVEKTKSVCKDPVVLVEQRLDFSRWVPEGFGTGDCVIVADGTLRSELSESTTFGLHTGRTAPTARQVTTTVRQCGSGGLTRLMVTILTEIYAFANMQKPLLLRKPLSNSLMR